MRAHWKSKALEPEEGRDWFTSSGDQRCSLKHNELIGRR